MQTLQIDQKKAKKLFPTATPEFKEMLMDTFGAKFFSEKITDRVKTFEDACEVFNINPICLFDEADTTDEIAYKKLKIIIRALNEGWTPDWSNGNQRKWYPWFEYTPSGCRFYDAGYVSPGTDSTGGSRLCFHSEELAIYAAKQFTDIYNQFLL